MYKPFDRTLYNENDKAAKDIALDFLLKTGLYELKVPLAEQKEAYKKYDFVIYEIASNKNIKVEVEVKRVWDKSGEWQGYDTLDVPERKSKSEADIYIMVNTHLDTIALASMKSILRSTIGYKATKYTRNEPFFKVALDNFRFYHKAATKWKKIIVK